MKLTSIHANKVVETLSRISKFSSHVKEYKHYITRAIEETGGVNDGIIKRKTTIPDLSKYEMVYSGPHLFVSNPIYKTPRLRCVLNSDYDVIDLSQITDNYIARTNYIPTIDIRLLRRVLRDYRYRGYSAMQTIKRCPSVSAGEAKWIFPFQELADATFNAALLYELGY